MTKSRDYLMQVMKYKKVLVVVQPSSDSLAVRPKEAFLERLHIFSINFLNCTKKYYLVKPFKCQFHKMVKHTQTIRL